MKPPLAVRKILAIKFESKLKDGEERVSVSSEIRVNFDSKSLMYTGGLRMGERGSPHTKKIFKKHKKKEFFTESNTPFEEFRKKQPLYFEPFFIDGVEFVFKIVFAIKREYSSISITVQLQ